MGIINVLDEQLANQIAAGEVVERPSSVVKELVENAIDAGSTMVDVEIEEGGLTLIRVKDNGAGIAPDDMERAFQRHATSKLRTSKDLFRIASLGFRGEALPSIAAVSRVTCTSGADDSGLAKKLVIEGGAVRSFEDAGAPQGTDIAVRDLFYNTPARLKYMKTIQTELGHVSDYMNRLALAHPGIAFTLRHNGNSLLHTSGNGDRLQVIAAVYGTSTARQMLAVSGDHPDYGLLGYISKPELTKANRNGMTTIVNGRYIRSFVLNQAILQAYHTLLPINRYPVVVLELGMHPGLVDVNVHPSKMEVRFSKEAELREFVEKALKEKLSGLAHIPSSPVQQREKPAFVQERISFHRPEPDDMPGAGQQTAGALRPDTGGSPAAAPFVSSRPTMPSGPSGPPSVPQSSSRGGNAAGASGYGAASAFGAYGMTRESQAAVPPDAAERLYAPSDKLDPGLTAREAAAALEQPLPVPPMPRSEDERALPADASGRDGGSSMPAVSAAGRDDDAQPDIGERTDFPELSWIGQMHGTYLIAQSEDGLYLVDQHAAHERINYEYYLRKFGEPAKLSQPLLVPLTLEFTAGEAAMIAGRLDVFAEAGVELEPFGGNSFLVRAHPEWLPKGDEQAVIEEMAEWVLSEKRTIDIGKLREKAAIMCSCKASIKANDRLTREEGEALLGRLAACMQPYTCPHGRPIIVHISTYQLEKMFKRVMS